MSGFYNTTTKTVDAFVFGGSSGGRRLITRWHMSGFVNTISNATNPLILYASTPIGDTTKVDTVTAGVAYQGATTSASGHYNSRAIRLDGEQDIASGRVVPRRKSSTRSARAVTSRSRPRPHEPTVPGHTTSW